MRRIIFPALVMLAALHSGAQVTVSKSIKREMDRIDTNTIRSHIAYLAHDDLKGRLPGTEGFQLAVDYVTKQFREMGVKPGGDGGGFVQKLVLRRSVLQNQTALAVLADDSGNRDTLEFRKLFSPMPHPLTAKTSVSAPLVFAGYGVDIPGVYSDYEGVNVQGKIVVMITGAPGGLHSTLTAHFSNTGNKLNTAASKGAVGAIIVNLNARTPGNVDAVIQSNVAMNPGKTIAYGRGFTGNLQVVLNGNHALLLKLFMGSGKNMGRALAELREKKPASFELPNRMKIAYETVHHDYESYNVVGLIEGSDKKLKKEYVVHSAHLDHMGISRAVNGDSIYNGAHDNASGVASLLEIARLYKKSKAKPKRSILVVMVTAEEMGLLGSSYFAANPTVPRNSIVANVNTDMPTLIAPLLSIVPLGAEHSTMMKHVQFAANQLGLEIENDPEPSENRFVRSDQYSFVMNGMPALHIKYGNKSNVPGFNLIDFVRQWRAKYYHKPADGMDGIFDFAAAKNYVQLNFLVSYSIAMTKERPGWNEGDLFGVVK